MTRRPRGLTSLLALAVGIALAVSSPHGAALGAPGAARAPTLSDETGLTVSIDAIDPAILTPGQPLELSGVVRNSSDHTWSDGKVYLEMSEQPATTKGALDDFALTGDTKFGDRVVTLGLFDEIGAIKAGQRAAYHLTIPFARLPIMGGTGVYHIAVAVLASVNGTRDLNADARTAALLPVEQPSQPLTLQTNVTTLIPVTAPVARQGDGTFASDQLASEVSYGGRLRNVLDFALDAPTDSVDLVVDPALLAALRSMADGYEVVKLSDGPHATPSPGSGQAAAAAWLADFDTVKLAQHVDFLPWGNANTSGLTAAGMPGVAEAAVRASQQFAADEGSTEPVVDWQNNGGSTRRGLCVARNAGAAVHVVTQNTLTRLAPDDVNGYPPPLAAVRTRTVPVITTVTRSDLAGEEFSRSMTALQFRQAMLSEALVRAISSTDGPTSVIAAPFHWNPGPIRSDLGLAAAYDSNVLLPVPLGTLNLHVNGLAPTAYAGPVELTVAQPAMTSGLQAAIRQLRDAGRVYTVLLTDGRKAETTFTQQLAAAGSSAWLWQPRRGGALIQRAAKTMSGQIRKVTITGPEFVALSSEAGRFPLTVSNGLDVSVTVNVSVVPRNPALHINPIDPIVLDPGQKRVIEVESKSQGSGVTAVRARLATTGNRQFGAPWNFDIRATRIGVAIWVLLGVLLAGLFSGAAIRIVRRIRSGGFRPRGQRPA